jgi:soluble lytic murein transglycosylase-like protein
MPAPSSVTVALSSEEVLALGEAADVLNVPRETLLAAAAATFARLCGFRKTGTASVRRTPNWGPQPEASLPAEILEVPLDADTAAQVEAAVGYVRWDGPQGVQAVTLPEYVVGAAMRLIRETRVDGSPPVFRGLAEQLFSPVTPRAESDLGSSGNGPMDEKTFVRMPTAPVAPPPAARPAYTLPRPSPSATAAPPAARPAYTLPRREPAESKVGHSSRPLRGAESPSAKRAKSAPPQPERGTSAGPGKGTATRPAGPKRQGASSAPASPSLGAIAWLRARPLVLAAAGMGVVLLVALVTAYAAAIAPTEVAPSAPHDARAAALTPQEPKPSTPAGDALRLDGPSQNEAAAAALQRWELDATTGTNVPASSTSPQKPGQDVDKLLAQRYGRPRVLADASLKPEAYDEDIALAIADVARIYPVPPALVKAVIRRESNFNPNAVSQVGAIGLMQLMPYTAKKVGLRISDLWVPKKNILGGTRLLSALLQYYDGDVIGALSAYNARPREPLAPLPKNGETPEYVQAVLRFYEEYNGAPLQRSGTSLDAPLRPGR